VNHFHCKYLPGIKELKYFDEVGTQLVFVYSLA